MKYDLHTHTHYSRGSTLAPVHLLQVAKKRGLDGIAVTDYGMLKGALQVKKLNKDKNFEVIVGSEIKTEYGDVLAYYLKSPITSRKFFGVIDEIHKQNGLAVIAHPFRTSLDTSHRFKLDIAKIQNTIDGIECFNGRMLLGNNEQAQEIAQKYKIAGVAGSDGHYGFEIGRAYTEFEGSLRDAIKKQLTRWKGTTFFGPVGGLLSFSANLITKQ